MMKKINFNYEEDMIREAICERYEPEEDEVCQCMAEKGLGAEDAIQWLKENYEPTDDEIAQEESDMNEAAYDEYCDSIHEARRDERWED